jgi:hypothetical protein
LSDRLLYLNQFLARGFLIALMTEEASTSENFYGSTSRKTVILILAAVRT